jgi:aspartate racemase
MKGPVIGIIGGMGPQAGIYLADRIVANSIASLDGDHLSVALLSFPSDIADRTAFLTGRSDQNPADGILDVALNLIGLGCGILGMPCNTAHAPAIRDRVSQEIEARHPEVRFLHLIEETARYAAELLPHAKRLGILATPGTYQQHLYEIALGRLGLEPVLPDERAQHDLIFRALYDAEFGIKAASNPISEQATELLGRASEHLHAAGAEALILGCTELPLAIPGPRFAGLPVIDSTTALARALIRAADPSRLLPL